MWKRGRYQIREAAGRFWLIDMEQSAETYCPPVGMNESGAIILKSFLETGDVKQCAQKLREEFGIELQEAEEDAKDFLAQLRAKGIEI